MLGQCLSLQQECEQLQKMYAAQQDERFLEHTQQQHVLYQQEQQILHQQIQVFPPFIESHHQDVFRGLNRWDACDSRMALSCSTLRRKAL